MTAARTGALPPMTDAASRARLQDLFRRENRSFLQYVAQATPWASDADRPLADKVRQLAAEELEALTKFAEWMESRHIGLPYLGAFPSGFTNFNFVDIRKLLKPLAAEQRKELADLEADLQAPADEDVRKQIESLIRINRDHLAALEETIGSAKPPAAVEHAH